MLPCTHPVCKSHEKPEAVGYQPLKRAAEQERPCEPLLVFPQGVPCHQHTGCFHFTHISTHLAHTTLRAFVFPLSEPQDRDGPGPCDCIPLPASRREQQEDSEMLTCSSVPHSPNPCIMHFERKYLCLKEPGSTLCTFEHIQYCHNMSLIT